MDHKFIESTAAIIISVFCGFIATVFLLLNTRVASIIFSVSFILGTIKMYHMQWRSNITGHANVWDRWVFVIYIILGGAIGFVLQLIKDGLIVWIEHRRKRRT